MLSGFDFLVSATLMLFIRAYSLCIWMHFLAGVFNCTAWFCFDKRHFCYPPRKASVIKFLVFYQYKLWTQILAGPHHSGEVVPVTRTMSCPSHKPCRAHPTNKVVFGHLGRTDQSACITLIQVHTREALEMDMFTTRRGARGHVIKIYESVGMKTLKPCHKY